MADSAAANSSGATSVGYIALDLVINSRLNEQLEKIRSMAESPSERIGEEIENAIAKPIEETAERAERALSDAAGRASEAVEDSLGEAFSRARREAEQSTDGIEEALERLQQRQTAAQDYNDVPEPRTAELGGFARYDPGRIMSEIEETAERARTSVGGLTEEVRERLGNFEVPDDPVVRLNQQLENTAEKLQLLQRKWQELSHAAEQAAERGDSGTADRLTEQLNSTERQIMQLEETYRRTQERIAAMTEEAAGASVPEIPEELRFRAADTEAGRLSQQLEIVQSQLRAAEEESDRLQASLAAVSDSVEGDRIRAQLDRVRQSMISLADRSDSLRRRISGLQSGSETAAASANRGFASTQRAAKKTSNVITRFFHSVKSAARRIFIMAGILAFFKAIRSAIQTAAKDNEQFSKSLNEVKGNLNVAFNPIMQSVMPALNTMMKGLAAVTRSVASFISGLFGTTYKQAAEAAKKLQDVNKEAKKAQMSTAGIDEMNILSDNSDSSEDDSGIDYDALGDGDKKAEELGAKVRKCLSEAFNFVGKKAKIMFQKLGEWATFSFVPTFSGIWDGLKTETAELYNTLSGIFSDIRTLGEPLKEYFAGDFTVFLQSAFANIGLIVLGLFDTFNMMFSDIWNVAVFPMLSSFMTLGLPVITQFSTEVVNTLGVLFTEVKKIFDMLWQEAVVPVLGFIAEIWGDLMKSISKFWRKWGKPIFDDFREAIELTGDTLKNIWETVLKPVFDRLMSVLDEIWKEHLKPLVDNFLDFVGELVDGALEIYNKFILPVVNWFVNEFGPPIAAIFNWLLDTVGNVIGGIIDELNGIITILKGIVQFITGVFTGDWDKAWQGIKNIFQGVWETFEGIVKTPINLIIDIVNGLISGLAGAFIGAANWIINSINDIFTIDIPDEVPVVGGTHFGLDIPNIEMPEMPQIPHLATGGLATAPTLAMVGDNKNARTDPEVIAPLSKLNGLMGDNTEVTELLKEIIELLKNGANVEIINYLFKGSREFSREVVKAYNKEKALSGGY